MTAFKTILAFDTALNNCSVGIHANGKNFSETQPMMQGHSEHLLPMAQRVLEKAKISYKDVEAIVTTVGPGAFTGLRIGVSTARAMAMALNIPLFGILTTQILAVQQARKEKKPITVILDTKREDFYVQSFDAKANPVTRPEVLAQDVIETEDSVLVGDGVERFSGRKSEVTIPDVELMVELLAKEEGHWFAEGADPVYLRGADVTASKRQRRIFEGSSVLK